ncbi:MAG: hypothetical protein QOF41_3466 [Methylobacteriaceae bacterium]|nr:hypothetical protein [Methylobacteriaceae bacterium]
MSSVARIAGPQSTFAERMGTLLDRIECRPAYTHADIEAFLRLRYEAYVKEGAVLPNDSQKLEDRFDLTGNAWNFGFYLDGLLVSAIRVHLLADHTHVSPALDAFPEILEPVIAAGKIVVDPNRFVVNPSVAREYPELPFVTVRAAYMGGVHFDADLMTATVRAEHQAFYRRYLSFKLACPPRHYPTLTKPLSLMLLDFKKDASTIAKRLPAFVSSATDRSGLYENSQALRHLHLEVSGRVPSTQANTRSAQANEPPRLARSA